jgi:hypothetical protein
MRHLPKCMKCELEAVNQTPEVHRRIEILQLELNKENEVGSFKCSFFVSDVKRKIIKNVHSENEVSFKNKDKKLLKV